MKKATLTVPLTRKEAFALEGMLCKIHNAQLADGDTEDAEITGRMLDDLDVEIHAAFYRV